MRDPVDAVARAVLYEGYLLYPYSPQALKNSVRWTFGGVHPRCWSEANGGLEPWFTEVQCLVIPPSPPSASDGGGLWADARLSVTVRFLHLLERRSETGPPSQEATERAFGAPDLSLQRLLLRPLRLPIQLGPRVTQEESVRREWRWVVGEASIAAERAAPGVLRVTVRVSNTTELPAPKLLPRERAVLHAMASTHAILRVRGARFVSLSDPPAALREAAADCQQVGAWPVMMGEPGSADTVLASPIILEDYPRVAEESPQDLFDSSEIDELLTLSILALTDDEKEAMRQGDERARRLLERAESLSNEELLRLHGTVRQLRPAASTHPERDP